MNQKTLQSRRQFIKSVTALGLSTALGWAGFSQAKTGTKNLITKAIPSSGEHIPVIGMGTWITFNVGNDVNLRNARTEVLRTFFNHGGQLVDSSPMYGSSEEVVGYALQKLKNSQPLFSATKTWTRSKSNGLQQFSDSQRLWKQQQFDLLQVHNLLSWQDHLESLKELKQQGHIRYIGITTSHGRRHGELEQILTNHPIDFVQLTYNMRDREVEKRLLPLAKEKGIAVIANRPLQGGNLIDDIERSPLPSWVKEFDCHNWAQFLLKFVVSHPAVTCAIPATSRIAHMNENMGAAVGVLPNESMRKRMLNHMLSL